MNKVIILANITRDIELKYLSSGSAVATFAVAHNERYTDKQGQKQERTSFFDVKAWGKQAEVVNQYFRKGSRILIEGALEQETWQAQDGSKRSKVVIRLTGFDFIDKAQGGQAYNQTGQAPQQHQQPPAQQPQPNQQGALPDISIDDEIPFAPIAKRTASAM